jgi:hypothetical protein
VALLIDRGLRGRRRITRGDHRAKMRTTGGLAIDPRSGVPNAHQRLCRRGSAERLCISSRLDIRNSAAVNSVKKFNVYSMRQAGRKNSIRNSTRRLAAIHISLLKGVSIYDGPMAINMQPLRGSGGNPRFYNPRSQHSKTVSHSTSATQRFDFNRCFGIEADCSSSSVSELNHETYSAASCSGICPIAV